MKLIILKDQISIEETEKNMYFFLLYLIIIEETFLNMDEDLPKIKAIKAFTIIILTSMPLDSFWCYY